MATRSSLKGQKSSRVTTWALVRISPSFEMIVPDPWQTSWPSTAAKICTTRAAASSLLSGPVETGSGDSVVVVASSATVDWVLSIVVSGEASPSSSPERPR